MPDTHDGLEFPLNPPPPGDLSNPAGLHHKAAGNVRPIRGGESSGFAPIFHPLRAFDRDTQFASADHPAGSLPPIRERAARWERLGRSVWHAHHHSLDGPRLLDVPCWLESSPLFAGVPYEPLPLEEEALPLRYGMQLEPHASGIAPSGRMTAFHYPANDPVPPAPLRFPQGWLPALPKLHMPMLHFDDGILPFRSPARQTITVFSLIGGTGRTSIAAGLARLLAGSGMRVLLADTCAFSLLPRLFGGGDARQGVVRTFFPASGEKNRTISLVSLAVDDFAGDDAEQYRILKEFAQESARMDRIIWDLSGAPLDWAAKVLNTSPQILIPLLPNANSLVQLRATERFINRCHEDDPSLHLRYVLNGFDERDPLHVDMRGRFRQLLGGRLLPVSMRSSPLVDEALSRGKTVVDHAPASLPVNDLWRLAQELNQLDTHAPLPASTSSEWVEH